MGMRKNISPGKKYNLVFQEGNFISHLISWISFNSPEIGCWLLLDEEENNPIIDAGLGTLLPVQNTTAPSCGTSLELHQCSNPGLNLDLTREH
jgi:hypothetical protein